MHTGYLLPARLLRKLRSQACKQLHIDCCIERHQDVLDESLLVDRTLSNLWEHLEVQSATATGVMAPSAVKSAALKDLPFQRYVFFEERPGPIEMPLGISQDSDRESGAIDA